MTNALMAVNKEAVTSACKEAGCVNFESFYGLNLTSVTLR